MDKRLFIFDLDGTIIDSRLGVTNSICYALSAYDINENPGNLTRFIGAPLREIFGSHFGITDPEQAVVKYREYFAREGIYENTVYPGIREVFEDLREAGKIMAVATTKATFYTNKILENLELAKYFSYVSGDEMDGSLSKYGKREILRIVLDNLDPRRELPAVMIGDKEYDITAAKELGIDSIGLLYGYGSLEELEGATWIVRTTCELRELILS